MAWYYGKFACGCDGRVNVIGKEKDRQWKIDRAFGSLCEDCYKKEMEVKRKEQNAKALEQSKEMELPDLEGTEKQIEWANTIRLQFIRKMDAHKDNLVDGGRYLVRFCREYGLNKDDYMEIEEEKREAFLNNFMLVIFEKATQELIKNNSAKFYIDNRDVMAENVIDLFKDIITKTEEDLQAENIQKDIIAETTVEPENVEYAGVVVITFDNAGVDVKYEKNGTLRIIVKENGYEWLNSRWHLKFKERLISTKDRAAEIGNKLLNAGFRISIQDTESLEMAVNGNYKKGYTRWITERNNKLGLFWAERNNELYNMSKRIGSSKWDSPYVVVDVSHFEEVLDFADVYGFGVSESALKLIETYKNTLSNIQVVSAAKVDEINVDKLDEILKSNNEILCDLKDE